jgi:hypothetical protein
LEIAKFTAKVFAVWFNNPKKINNLPKHISREVCFFIAFR